MFKMLMNKDYLVIVLMAVATFLMLYTNPVSLQNKRYHTDGTACPDASWHSLILLLIGTGIYVFIHKYTCRMH